MLFSLLVTAILVFGQLPLSFDDYVREQERQFDKFVEDDEAAFAKYKADVEKKWNEFINSTRTEWASYSDDLEGLSRVNFADGVIVIEAIVETHSPGDMNEARAKVAKQVELLLSEDNATGTNILAGQLRLANGKPVTPENVNSFAEEVTPETKETVSHFKGEDGVDRMKVRLTGKTVHAWLNGKALFGDAKITLAHARGAFGLYSASRGNFFDNVTATPAAGR